MRISRPAVMLALALYPACFNPSGNDTGEPTTDDESSGSTSTGTTTTGGSPTTDTSSDDSTPTGDPPTGTSTGMTTTAPGACDDAQQNGDETDVDCGGACAPCGAGLGCADDHDCEAMACLDGQCLADPACLAASDCPAQQCTQATCVDFVCGEAAQMPGSPCDDGQVCTADEACAAGVCAASSPKPIALIDVPDDSSLGLYFDGTAAKDSAGTQLGAAGDFNGDGLPDLYLVANKPQPRVYVLFGGPTLATATLAGVAKGQGGVTIDVDVAATVSVAAVGNVDSKGSDDLVLGTPASSDPGGAYVVTGRADTKAIQLSTKPAGVHLLAGPDIMADNGFGTAVAGLGDVDGDGVADFVVTAPRYATANEKSGAVFVVYGSNMLADGAIDAFVGNGRAYRISGPTMHDNFGLTVAGAGDFNGDKRRDLLVGQPSWAKGMGRAWVIYTPPMPTSFQLATTPDAATALALTGTKQLTDYIGKAVAGAGDFNGDGFADALISGGEGLKQTLVVYGGKYGGEIAAATLVDDKHGSVITTAGNDVFGPAIAGGRDVNGDHIDDLLLGAPGSGMNGAAYVAFGAEGDPFTRTVAELSAGQGGFAVAGPTLASLAGASVALIPSVNADELADLFIGATSFDIKPASDEGRAYVVHGGACEG